MKAWVATATTLLALDLLWLGVVGRPLYDRAIGELLRPQALRIPALIFYLFYVTVTWRHAVVGARTLADAAKRGASLGFVAYGVYELTNWTVLEGWPAFIVPIDWAWGILLTGTAAAAGFLAGKPST